MISHLYPLMVELLLTTALLLIQIKIVSLTFLLQEAVSKSTNLIVYVDLIQ